MIEVQGLTKRYGDKVAVDDLTLHRAARRRDRLPRAERRRQVHDDAADPRPRPAQLGRRRWSTAATTKRSPAPLHEVGALLDAKDVHGGRTARSHLLALAQTNGIPAHAGRRGARD